MTIITDDYKTGLKRFYASGNAKKADPPSENKQKLDFGGFLGSIERSQRAPAPEAPGGLMQGSVVSPEIKTGAIKNLSEEAPLQMQIPQPIAYNGILGDIPLEIEDEIQVKLPRQDTIKAQTIPETPKIVSSRRLGPNPLVNLESQDLEVDEIKKIIITAGQYHGVDPSLGLAIARVESAFNPKAISSDGHASKGIFQLLDSTAKDIHASSGLTEPYKPYDVSMNTFLGVGHFRRLLDLFSKETVLAGSLKTRPAQSADDLEKLAVAAYNAGEGNVANAQAKAEQNGLDPSRFENIREFLPEITKSYVDKVSSLRSEFANKLPDSVFG